ncbi:MAG: RtcB family protein [Geminicoccaceae bacterium]|nr:MAG: RtcB family protein [Geminicoccaceae bacterium]
MDRSRLHQISDVEWELPPTGDMNVPVVLYADAPLLDAMDDEVLAQAANVARLPGIVRASFALPDAHWGYGFPIGGVAAFDAEMGGVISAGGVGFDISCGVRTLLTGLTKAEILQRQAELADALAAAIPAGLGQHGALVLDDDGLDAMLEGGAAWAVAEGYGEPSDLPRIEHGGRAAGADPACVSAKAKQRQRREMGTLGSGNHYLEVQEVADVLDAAAAEGFGLVPGEVVVTIHCGSRGLGHQIGTDFLRLMTLEAEAAGWRLPDRELAAARINSPLGQRYLVAMRAGINCALANRQIVAHLARGVFADLFPAARLPLLFDVSHNTCHAELHDVEDARRMLFVHRKGATRALGPGHPDLCEELRAHGQPVLIGGSMGTESWVLAGTAASAAKAFGSAVHGAGRSLSRRQAVKRWTSREVVDALAARGILVRCRSWRGIVEEAPGAYKDVRVVVDAAHRAGLARKVARLRPLVCIKG